MPFSLAMDRIGLHGGWADGVGVAHMKGVGVSQPAPERYAGGQWTVEANGVSNSIDITITELPDLNGGTQTGNDVRVGSTVFNFVGAVGLGTITVTDAATLPNGDEASVTIRPVIAGHTWPSSGTDEEQGWATVKPVTPAEDAGYETESEAIFAAFTTPPDTTRKGHINTLVAALKAAGVWAKLDVFYVFAAADSQAALINWKNPGTFDGSTVGSPTFAADRGFSCTASTAYVNSNFNPTTAGGLFSQNSAHMSARNRTSLAAGTNRIFGSLSGGQRFSAIVRNTGDVLYARVNESTGSNLGTVTDAVDLFTVNRSASNAVQTYKGATLLTVNGLASAGLPSANLVFGADQASGATMQISSGSIGGSLTGGEVADFHAAELAYMQAVGAA